MQRVFFVLSISFFLSVFILPAIAQETTDPVISQTQAPRQVLQENRASKRENIEQKKQDLQARIQANRDEMKEKIAKKEEALQERLSLIKDQRKKAAAERINTKVATFNTNHTNRLSSAVTTLSEILTKIKEGQGTLTGENTSSLSAAITNAEEKIQQAQEAVAAQAVRDYTLTIQDEATLRNDIGQTVSTFRTDIAATHKTVVDAKQAVMQAAQILTRMKQNTTSTVSEGIQE